MSFLTEAVIELDHSLKRHKWPGTGICTAGAEPTDRCWAFALDQLPGKQSSRVGDVREIIRHILSQRPVLAMVRQSRAIAETAQDADAFAVGR
jgi:hypothetical protein